MPEALNIHLKIRGWRMFPPPHHGISMLFGVNGQDVGFSLVFTQGVLIAYRKIVKSSNSAGGLGLTP